jgi:hypothetical protein
MRTDRQSIRTRTFYRKGSRMPIRNSEPASSMNQRDREAVMALQGVLANAEYVKGSALRRDSARLPRRHTILPMR